MVRPGPAAAVALTVVGGHGCGDEVGAASLERAVGTYMAERGIAPERIHCPAALAREPGAQVRCTATIEGYWLGVIVAAEGPDAEVVVRPEEDTLVAARVETEIAQTLREQGVPAAEVHCEGSVWIVYDGAEHFCDIVLEDGVGYRWRGVFTGEGSDHRVYMERAEDVARRAR